jgi:hypothetical protein
VAMTAALPMNRYFRALPEWKNGLASGRTSRDTPEIDPDNQPNHSRPMGRVVR